MNNKNKTPPKIGLNWEKQKTEGSIPVTRQADGNLYTAEQLKAGIHEEVWQRREIDERTQDVSPAMDDFISSPTGIRRIEYRLSMSTLDFDNQQTYLDPSNEQPYSFDNFTWSKEAQEQNPEGYLRALMNLKHPTADHIRQLHENTDTKAYQTVLRKHATGEHRLRGYRKSKTPFLEPENAQTAVMKTASKHKAPKRGVDEWQENISIVGNDVYDDIKDISREVKKRKSAFLWSTLILLCIFGFSVNYGGVLNPQVSKLVEGFINATIFCAIMAIVARVSSNRGK